MNNNDILRRVRYALDLNNSKIIELFALESHKISQPDLNIWLKKEKEEGYEEMPDKKLSILLNGLISDKRGKRDDKPNVVEDKLTNNIILRKFRIALNLRDEDMIEIFMLADMKVSKHELSAFFRSPDKSQYRICKDQFLRNFLYGIQKRYHGIGKNK